MVRLRSRTQKLLLKYLTATPSPDLSRAAMAEAVAVHPVNLSTALSDLIERGLVTVERGRYNKFICIKPTFEFKPGNFYVGRERRSKESP